MTDLINKILVFDLDDTLIDTQMIKRILFDYAGSLGCSEKQIKSMYVEIRDKGFTLEKYASVLADIAHRPIQEILAEIRAEIMNYRDELVYKDAVDFLELCKRMGIKLHLFTFGSSVWQAEKIEFLGLKKYFDQTVSTNNEVKGKMEELSKIVGKGDGDGDDIVLFNDKLKEIVAALERYPKMTAYLRSVQQLDGRLLQQIDPALRERIEILPNFRLLMSEVYDGNKR